MGKLFNLKPVVNKSNGQIVLSLPKKKLPPSLRKAMKGSKVKFIKMKIEGFDLNG